ncbi:MAG: hypothetical protein IRZ32_09095 [Solirubrobacteraceae bacterium]|nr:hypothetical protein [Solirubrobacteraceae bacterium]
MPRTAVLAVLLALAAAASPAAAAPVHVVQPDGRVVVRDDPSLPAADPLPPAPATAPRAAATAPAGRAAARTRTFARAVDDLNRQGRLDPLVHQAAKDAAAGARSLLRKLPNGTSRTNLSQVRDLLDGLAARNQVTPGRVPVLTEILRRNTEYWNTGKALSYGARVEFSGSRIVWQYYPGAALQPQWLGTFGAANALWRSNRRASATALAELLDEVLALASPRAGGIAWESFFAFSGAPPVWVSALSQGTGIQALSRAAQKLNRPDYLEAATQALGIFQAAPPEGVALKRNGGTHYLIYSTNPRLLVLNGFIQALNGLWDYAQISQNPLGLQLFEAGDRAAQAELADYDTGAWSLYEGVNESSLSYHQLVREFLQNLCQRTQTEAYCATAERFLQDEKTPPEIRIRTSTARAGRPVPIRFTLSKKSTVSLLVDGTPITSATLAYGDRTLTWAGRRRPGQVEVTLKARDLAGNTAEVSRTITLKRK